MHRAGYDDHTLLDSNRNELSRVFEKTKLPPQKTELMQIEGIGLIGNSDILSVCLYILKYLKTSGAA